MTVVDWTPASDSLMYKRLHSPHVSQPVVVEVEAAEVPVICASLMRPAVPEELLTAFGTSDAVKRHLG